MKTHLTLFASFLALGGSVSLAAEFAGVNVPALFDPLVAFSAFVGVLFVLGVWNDYDRPRRTRFVRLDVPLADPRRARRNAAHPLAA